LRAESERIGKSFESIRENWNRLWREWRCDDSISRGAAAYVARMTAVFGRLQIAAEDKFRRLEFQQSAE